MIVIIAINPSFISLGVDFYLSCTTNKILGAPSESVKLTILCKVGCQNISILKVFRGYDSWSKLINGNGDPEENIDTGKYIVSVLPK